jgi:energy-coupling factor transport system ATP-binding protein
VLDGLNLSFERGTYTLIAGPTGSGKSTLALAILGALEDVARADVEGEVLVDGTVMTEADALTRARLVSAVWQRPVAQLFRSTILDEVRSALDYRLVPAAEADARAREQLRLVGLDAIDEERHPATLSGGERQRLALAAALLQEAPVLVLDEATSALDRAATDLFVAALERARATRDLTVIAIDHRPDAHLEAADRLVVLEAGRVALDGTPASVLAEPHAGELGLRRPGERSRTLPTLADARTEDPAHATLRLDRVGVRLGDSAILDDLTCALPTGAVALVTGDNGAGKSTFLRLLADELRPAAGRVAPRGRARTRAGIGAAPQHAADLFFTERVIDEVGTVLARGRRPSGVLRGLARGHLERAGLAAEADTHPLRLSGGQRQRLAVLLATVAAPGTPPALVLLDEPTSAQDRAGADLVCALIQANASERVTIIATHEPAAFASFATHLLAFDRIPAEVDA